MDSLQNIVNTVVHDAMLRIDVALLALSMVILLQIFSIIIGYFLKKTWPVYPVIEAIGRPVAIFLNDRLNRQNRSDYALAIRGIFATVLIIVIICLLAVGIESLTFMAGIGVWADVVLLGMTLSPLAAIRLAYQLSSDKPFEGTYLQAAYALNQNIVHVDIHGYRRLSVRLMALALGEWCITPLFFYLIGGILAAYAYIALSLFCRVAGNARVSRPFMAFVLPIWHGATLLPGIICIVQITVASIFSAGGNFMHSFRALRYVSRGQGIEAAYAYAQNVVLGGAEHDRLGDGIRRPWIGSASATAQLSHQDVLRGCILHGIAVFLSIVGLLAAYLYL